MADTTKIADNRDDGIKQRDREDDIRLRKREGKNMDIKKTWTNYQLFL